MTSSDLSLDAQIRRGWGRDWFPVTPPYVPGAGVAGRVICAGDGVEPGWMGRRVVADTSGGGGYAERAVVPEEGLVAVPDGLGLPEAAALLHDGRRAFGLPQALRIPRGGVGARHRRGRRARVAAGAARARRARGSCLRRRRRRGMTRLALSEAAAGRIRPLIGQSVPLERAAQAHAAMEARQVVGKTLLTVGAP